MLASKGNGHFIYTNKPINVVVYLAKITNEPRVRQQDVFAARGDVTQFQHREVRLEGLIMFSKETIIIF